MSVEEQRLYVQGVDQLKRTIADTVADMLSAHQQLKQAAAHHNMVGVANGIEVLQRYAIVLTGAVRLVPPTPNVGSDFQEPVPYPEPGNPADGFNPTDPSLPKELHVNKDELGGIEDLSTPKVVEPEYITEPPEVVARRRKKA